jgi:YebC/PmpR family DNA-binding regulatory protein
MVIKMSGHSKWKNIQRTKGAQDAKRANMFTKIARELIVAAKEGGGGDPANNSRLAAAVAKAKASNMPNDSIKRTIEKALGAGSSDNYERITYEGYGPCGVAVIVEAMTDNRNWTAAEIRHHFDKYGGNMGTSGCVSWFFERKGVIVIDNEDGEYDEEKVLGDALDAGADDVETGEDIYEVYTVPDDFVAVSGALEGMGYRFLSAQVEMIPKNYITLTDPVNIKNMEKMLDVIEDSDDVQNVWHNSVLPDSN